MASIDEYKQALDNKGEKLKELILDRASHDADIDLWDFVKLVEYADSN